MSIERHSGRQQLICDGCSDSQPMKYQPDEFDIMISDAKADGWIIQREDGEWTHYCPNCQ